MQLSLTTILKELRIDEIRIKELVDDSNRSQNIFTPKKIDYIGLSTKRKLLYFKCGKYYQKVNLPDWNVISRLKGTDNDKLEMALDGDVKVFCSCSDWLYGGFAYIATQTDYYQGTSGENRPPDVRNPNLNGTVCKHLTYLLSNIDSYKDNIVVDVDKSRKSGYVSIISDKDILKKIQQQKPKN